MGKRKEKKSLYLGNVIYQVTRPPKLKSLVLL